MIVTNEIYDKAELAIEGLAKRNSDIATVAALEVLRAVRDDYRVQIPSGPVVVEIEEAKPLTINDNLV